MIWIGDYKESVQKCIDSFAQFHQVYLWTYSLDIKYNNCIIKDLNEICKLEEVHSNLTLTSFKVDWFRLKILYKYGGWYSDCDNFCINPLDFIEDTIFTYFTGNFGDLNNSIFKCPKESTIIKDLLDTYTFDEHRAPYLEFSKKCLNQNVTYLNSNILHFKIKDLQHLDKTITKVIHMFNVIHDVLNYRNFERINTKLNE